MTDSFFAAEKLGGGGGKNETGKKTEAAGAAQARADARRRVEVSPRQRFSTLITEVQEQLKTPAVDREVMRGNLLELFDLAAEITAADPSVEQKLVRGLVTLLRVAKSREVVFSSQTREMSSEQHRSRIDPLIAEMRTLIQSADPPRERMAEVLRQLLDHTVALGSGDTTGSSLAKLLRIAKGRQVKLGGVAASPFREDLVR